jgi:signal-transduction protein with cAMP-binding, CBS, and nucleotidyltransferase domain
MNHHEFSQIIPYIETEYFDNKEKVMHLTSNPNCLFIIISGKINLRIVNKPNYKKSNI